MPDLLQRILVHPNAAGADAGTNDALAIAAAEALGDLLGVANGDDQLAAAALHVSLDPRTRVWMKSMISPERHSRVMTAASYLVMRARVGVSMQAKVHHGVVLPPSPAAPPRALQQAR